MAFVKRTWKDRISEFPNRRTINDGNVTKQVTVGRDEGNITEEGDSFDASNMNDLEQRIEDAYGDVQGLVASEVAQQYDSANVIFDAEPTEGHGTGYTVTSEGIKTAIDSGLVHKKTVSGSIVHITDGADNIPVKSLLSQIVAVQSGSGTPSPSNPRTISGFDSGVVSVCGINVWDEEWESGIYNSSGVKGPNPDYIRSTNFIPVVPNTNYYYKAPATGRICYYDKSQNLIERSSTIYDVVITTPADCYYITFFTKVTTYSNDVYINYPSSDTDYHAYNGNTYTFPFGQTVAKGTLNVTTGELTITHEILTLDGTENITLVGSGTQRRFNCGLYRDYSSIAYSSHFIPATNNSMPWGYYRFVSNYLVLMDNNEQMADVTALKTWLANQYSGGTPVQFLCELANPITLAITSQDIPTLLGENNIFSNCGDVEVEYYVDTDAIYAIRDVIDELAMQSDWNEADNTKADYIKNKPTIPANADFSLSGLSDTDISSPSAGQVLVFDGDNWVNSDVEDNYLPNYWSLFADQNTSNTIKTLNVVSGRKISDFSVLFAVVIRESGERVSTIIPVGRFTNGIWVSLTEVDSINTQRWYEVKYVDDEHITVQCSTNATGSEVYIYGLGTAATYS